MNPVLIFRHIACEGPAYLSEFLAKANIPYQIIRIDEGEKVPENTEKISGLIFMGGPMSVNDSLPWIEPELKLIRQAHESGLPVLGHCLGGQLISKALGGDVVRNKVTEIGWFPVVPVDSVEAPEWLHTLSYETEIFHWHGETFSLPNRAIPLFTNGFCQNQGFILQNTLALQCHVEMQHDDIREWLSFYKTDIPLPSASVQSPETIVDNLEQRIKLLHKFADVLYSHWLTGFK